MPQHPQEVDVRQLAALLPRPGDGEREKQLPVQRMLDLAVAARGGIW